MLKSIDIIIFIEHAGRELHIAKYLREKLTNSGCSVIIKSLLYDTFSTLLLYKPECIITPLAGTSNGSVVKVFFDAYNHNIKYINLNYEQFVNTACEKIKAPQRINVFNQIQLCWNENFYNILKRNGIKEDLLHITGRPYDDYLVNYLLPKKHLINKEIKNKYNIPKDKKIMFVAMTDGLVHSKKERIDSFINAGVDKTLLDGIKYTRKANEYMFEWVTKITNEKNEYHFILRPHPSVDIEIYKQKIKNTNVTVTKQGNALEFLIICECLITDISTLTHDARNIGKKVIRIKPLDVPSHYRPLDYLDYGFTTSNLDQFKISLNKKFYHQVENEKLRALGNIEDIVLDILKNKPPNKKSARIM